MRIDSNQKRTLLSGVFVAALLALCGVLGALQYRWIGEVSVADRERLRKTLEASLERLSQDFDSELAAAWQGVAPDSPVATTEELAREIPERYELWRKSSRQSQMFRRIAMAEPRNTRVELRELDLRQGTLRSVEWPAEWNGLRARMEMRLTRQEPRPGQNAASLQEPGTPASTDGLSFEVPVPARPTAQPRPGQFGRRELAWLIFELNPEFVRETVMPELLQRHLGAAGSQEYQVEVRARTSPPVAIYRSDVHSEPANAAADATVGLFEVHADQMFRGGGGGPGPGGGFGRRGFGGGRGGGGGPARWEMSVRHRNGSLEAVVASTRLRNLTVTGGVLLLMLGSVGALFLFTRRAQKLAKMQMEFVAGVSHELRTPLTVIHTAAYNLRGKTANNPTQVERYGALIQQESGRLKDMVEQVLRFAGANAGRVIQTQEPVSVEWVIEQAAEAGLQPVARECVVEKDVAPDLPVILGDAGALKQAIENLIGNAVKYGMESGNWIGVSASRLGAGSRQMIEIRVQDHGRGIPQDEQKHIFDPFFRGRHALQEQIHGTGLGLNLVKKIVEAHGGSIQVRSEPMKGTSFIVRLPAAPPEYQNGFAHTTG